MANTEFLYITSGRVTSSLDNLAFYLDFLESTARRLHLELTIKSTHQTSGFFGLGAKAVVRFEAKGRSRDLDVFEQAIAIVVG